MESELYYILDGRSCVGNCGLWWAPNGNGYVCNIEEAGLFSKEQLVGLRKTDIPILKSIVDQNTVKHVSMG